MSFEDLKVSDEISSCESLIQLILVGVIRATQWQFDISMIDDDKSFFVAWVLSDTNFFGFKFARLIFL